MESDFTEQLVTRGHRVAAEQEGKIIFRYAEEIGQTVRVPYLDAVYRMSENLHFISCTNQSSKKARGKSKLLPSEAQKTFPWLIVPKASKSEKERGLNKSLYTCECFILYDEKCKGKNITHEEKLAKLKVDMEALHLKAIEEYGTQINVDTEWSTLLFGKSITEQFQKGTASTTKTEIPLTTSLQISKWLISSLIKDTIQDVTY